MIDTPWANGSRVTSHELFVGFLRIGLMGFGGVAAVARHEIVDRRGWLSDTEYGQVLGIGKVLPGANTVNSAVLIGDRFAGLTGALAAVAGLMAIPLIIVVALATAYEELASNRYALSALQGVAAAAAGMVIGTAAKLVKSSSPAPEGLFTGSLAVIAIVFFQAPLAGVLLALAPVAIALTFLQRRRGDGG